MSYDNYLKIAELREDCEDFINLYIYLQSRDLQDIYMVKHSRLVKHIVSIYDDLLMIKMFSEMTIDLTEKKL